MKFRAALIAVLSGITNYASAISMPISDSAFIAELNNIQQLVAAQNGLVASPQVDPVMLNKIGEQLRRDQLIAGIAELNTADAPNLKSIR